MRQPSSLEKKKLKISLLSVGVEINYLGFTQEISSGMPRSPHYN